MALMTSADQEQQERTREALYRERVAGETIAHLRADLERVTVERDAATQHHADYHRVCSMGGNTPCPHEAERDAMRAVVEDFVASPSPHDDQRIWQRAKDFLAALDATRKATREQVADGFRRMGEDAEYQAEAKAIAAEFDAAEGGQG